MIIAPRRRTRSARRAAWLIAIAAAAAILYVRGAFAFLTLPLLADLYLAPVLVALPVVVALLPTDPRPAIACSFIAAFVAMVEIADQLATGARNFFNLPLTLIVLSVTLLVLAFTTTRTRALKERDPV